MPFPSLGDFPDPGIKTTSLVFPALAEGQFTTELPGKPTVSISMVKPEQTYRQTFKLTILHTHVAHPSSVQFSSVAQSCPTL